MSLYNVFWQIKDSGHHGGRDEEFDALVLDEDSEEKVSLSRGVKIRKLCTYFAHSC